MGHHGTTRTRCQEEKLDRLAQYHVLWYVQESTVRHESGTERGEWVVGRLGILRKMTFDSL